MNADALHVVAPLGLPYQVVVDGISKQPQAGDRSAQVVREGRYELAPRSLLGCKLLLHRARSVGQGGQLVVAAGLEGDVALTLPDAPQAGAERFNVTEGVRRYDGPGKPPRDARVDRDDQRGFAGDERAQ